jgi:hypothetical protein
MRFKHRRDQNERKWRKTHFEIQKNAFSLLPFWGWSFDLGF